jgi:4-hydroxy-3-methylbut-2-en-1-yl diphosphate reductase
MSRPVIRELEASGVTVARGEVLVPTEVGDPLHGTLRCSAAPLVAGSLQRKGRQVRLAPVPQCEENEAAADPVLFLATCPQRDGSTAAIAAVACAEDRLAVASARGAVEEWAAVCDTRSLISAGSPWCQGALQAESAARQALADHSANGRTVYLLGPFAATPEVSDELVGLGAVLTDSLASVGSGDVVVFLAHGAPPDVRKQAAEMDITVVDATCPLVAAAQSAAHRIAERGHHLALVGQSGNAATAGLIGEASGHVTVVERPGTVALHIPDSRPVSYLLEPGIPVEAGAPIAAALRSRYPAIRNGNPDDICYAPSDRVGSIREVATGSDLMLVLGDAHSADTRLICGLARDAGTKVHVVAETSDITPAMLSNAHTVGTAASTSAPGDLQARVITALSGLGKLSVAIRQLHTEMDSAHSS